MRKNALPLALFFACLVGINCKRKNSPSSREENKAIYIEQFRLEYFRKMLSKSYNNSPAIQEIISSDHSGFTEPVLTGDDYRLIDSLTTIDNYKMKLDSAAGNKRAEGAQGKRPFGLILEKLGNGWLDSLANERFRSEGIKD